MNTRALGNQGLRVSELGLGCMGMSWAYGAPGNEEESISVIHRATELGIDFFDTAEIYGPFTNEVLVGKALRDRRERVVIATKFGFDIGEDGMRRGLNSSPENVRRACDASLARLGVDQIDLFYQHRLDRSVPIEETVGAMAELVRDGKVRYLGLSEVGAETLRRAHAVHPITALQSEYSLWERGIEDEILPTLRELGIGMVPYCPLGRGFLTGQIKRPEDIPENDYRRTDPRFQGENFMKNLDVVRAVEEIAREKGTTPAGIALAWLLHQGDDIVPIPGTKHLRHLEENAASVTIALTADDLARLDMLGEPGAIAGERYGEMGMKAIDR
ncbi:MAG: aldo/keto reductase [Chlorobi bacterium]|nr:aldo/keto reductase [Chlorobiota bacterium]